MTDYSCHLESFQPHLFLLLQNIFYTLKPEYDSCNTAAQLWLPVGNFLLTAGEIGTTARLAYSSRLLTSYRRFTKTCAIILQEGETTFVLKLYCQLQM